MMLGLHNVPYGPHYSKHKCICPVYNLYFWKAWKFSNFRLKNVYFYFIFYMANSSNASKILLKGILVKTTRYQFLRRWNHKIKFIYSEKATKFCEISINYFSYPCVLPVKLLVEFSQNFVAFSEYMNFNKNLRWFKSSSIFKKI